MRSFYFCGLMWVAFLAFVPGISLAGYHLDCSDPTGRSVCIAIRKVESMAQPCIGSGCDHNGLIRQMGVATARYIETLAETASEQAGNFARDASYELCGLAFTGHPDVIRRFVVTANRFLEAMLELQQISGIEDTETCELIIDG
jgi:hypothetical protein